MKESKAKMQTMTTATPTTDALDVLSERDRLALAECWRSVLAALEPVDDDGLRALIEGGCVALEGSTSSE